MKAKRLAALILVLALALALSGCGDDGWYEPKDSASYYVEGQDKLLARLRELGAGDTLLNRLGPDEFEPVSYTHLDVYKRQHYTRPVYTWQVNHS